MKDLEPLPYFHWQPLPPLPLPKKERKPRIPKKNPTTRPDRDIWSWNLKRPLIRVTEEEWITFQTYCLSIDLRCGDCLGHALELWMKLSEKKRWPNGKPKKGWCRVPYFDEEKGVYLK